MPRADPASYAVTTIASGLNAPWSIAILPDGRTLVTEREGRLLAIGSAGTVWPIALAGLPPVLREGGAPLMAVLADADFAAVVSEGHGPAAIDGWAVHAGGRSILDAVETSLALPPDALASARGVLHDHGNMSSATLMFTLARMLDGPPIERGVALAFGPGLAAEGLGFRSAP